ANGILACKTPVMSFITMMLPVQFVNCYYGSVFNYKHCVVSFGSEGNAFKIITQINRVFKYFPYYLLSILQLHFRWKRFNQVRNKPLNYPLLCVSADKYFGIVNHSAPCCHL